MTTTANTGHVSGRALDRRSFVRGVGLAALVVGAPGALAACGGGDEGSGKLDFWWNASVESSEQMTTWMKQVIADFEASNSGSKVESVIQPPEQLIGNFRTACQSKSGPGLAFQYAGPYTMQFVWQKCVAPLDDLIDASELDHITPAASLEEYRFDGKLWALPWYNPPVVLAYNKALFDKAGLDAEAPPRTLDALIDAAGKLQAKGIVPWGYGLKNLTGIGNLVNLFCMQELDDPKQMLDIVTGEADYTDAQYSGWLGWLRRLADEKVFNDDVTSLEYQDSQNMFLAGKSAMAITSTLPDFHKALGKDLGVLVPPKAGSGELAGMATYNPHPLFVTSFAEDQKLAAKFLAYLHRPEVLTGMYEASGFFPADDRFDTSALKTPQDKQLYKITTESSSVSYQNYWPPQMDRENVFLAVQAVFAGSKSPAKAAADVQTRLASWRKSQPSALENFKKMA